MKETTTQSLSGAWDWIASSAPNILMAILILIIGFWLSGLVKRFIVRMSQRHEKLDDTLFQFLGSLARYAILAFTAIMVLERFGVTTTSLVALIGAAGLAIGLALQGTLSNLAAGVMLLIFRPYKVGDFVDGAGTFGKVASLSLFTTEMETFDNQYIIIPNSELWGKKLINHSHHKIRGVDLTFGVSYGTDLKKAEKSIRKVLAAHPQVLDDPEPFIAVDKLNESSVDFIVRPFCDGAHYFDLRYSLPQQVKEQFDRDKIEIPFPHRKIIMAK
jgi:small conductance mechanosensitive channel